MPLTDSSRTIGVVASVESERLLIQLDEAAPALVIAGSSGILPVGAINSYLTIDVGPHRVVAVITAIRISEDRKKPDAPIDDTIASRYIEATLIGRIEGRTFTPGLVTFPSLFAPVSAASPQEISCLFRPSPRFRLRLGEAVVAAEQDVLLDPDALLSRHFAVLGSTGSGKSCTVTGILEGLAELATPSATVIVFDANGEYFHVGAAGKTPWNTLRLGLTAEDADARLIAPHWLMTMREHVDLFAASQGVQEPLLHRAVLEAKLHHDGADSLIRRLDLARKALRTIDAISNANGPVQAQIAHHFQALEKLLIKWSEPPDADSLYQDLKTALARWTKLKLVETDDNGKANWDRLDAIQTGTLESLLDTCQELISDSFRRLGVSDDSEGNADAPQYYDLRQLLTRDLPRIIELEAAQDSKLRGFASSLLLRIARLLSDDRYSFITQIPQFPDGLAAFLKLLLGRWPQLDKSQPWSFRDNTDVSRYQAIILDLSEVGSDVLIAVTSLIGRVILEFAQRVRPRASIPILLVLEEAHRYVPARTIDDNTFGKSNVFERIAKEGRKFGVSLCIASQRPSELSKTVLSQCGTLVVHRIVNPDDQDLIRFASPVASRDVLRQLPSLAKQHAVVLGEAVPAPTYVRVRDVEQVPQSSDPQFMKYWQSNLDRDAGLAEIDSVAAAWSKVRPQVPKLNTAEEDVTT